MPKIDRLQDAHLAMGLLHARAANTAFNRMISSRLIAESYSSLIFVDEMLKFYKVEPEIRCADLRDLNIMRERGARNDYHIQIMKASKYIGRGVLGAATDPRLSGEAYSPEDQANAA
jgi:hypothetical protein